MKYHGYQIIKVPEDLGEDVKRLNCLYEIYKNDEYVNVALTLSSAKDFIDNGEDQKYL